MTTTTEQLTEVNKNMTIKEVADALDVNEITVRRAIKELAPNKIQARVKTLLNEVEVYQITEHIKTNKRVNSSDFKVAHGVYKIADVINDIDENDEESMDLIIAKSIEVLQRKIAMRDKKIREDAPKVEAYNRLVGVDTDQLYPMKDVADRLNIKNLGRNKLFRSMRSSSILDSNNIPYRNFIDSGYFEVKTRIIDKPNGDTVTSTTTYMTHRGFIWLNNRIQNAIKKGTFTP